MGRRELSDWAAIAEIVGTIAVVVSLVFVVQSLNQNTEALQNTNLNHVYDRYDAQNSDLANNPELASMYVKRILKLEGLTASEAQLLFTLRRDLNQWEQYFMWNADGLLDRSDWLAWDDYFQILFSNSLPQTWWNALRPYYADDFAKHVDQIYAP
jgi:hypothetical protein